MNNYDCSVRITKKDDNGITLEVTIPTNFPPMIGRHHDLKTWVASVRSVLNNARKLTYYQQPQPQKVINSSFNHLDQIEQDINLVRSIYKKVSDLCKN